MAVETTATEIGYAGDGVTLVFAIPFFFVVESDGTVGLLVQVINDTTGAVSVRAQDTDYSVSGVPNPAGSGIYENGGTLTLVAVVPVGSTLRIFRKTRRTQETVYSEGDRFPAKSHEHGLDRLMAVLQEMSFDGTTAGKPTDIGTSGKWRLAWPFIAGGVFAWAWCETDVDGAAVNDWRPVGGISLL